MSVESVKSMLDYILTRFFYSSKLVHLDTWIHSVVIFQGSQLCILLTGCNGSQLAYTHMYSVAVLIFLSVSLIIFLHFFYVNAEGQFAYICLNLTLPTINAYA